MSDHHLMDPEHDHPGGEDGPDRTYGLEAAVHDTDWETVSDIVRRRALELASVNEGLALTRRALAAMPPSVRDAHPELRAYFEFYRLRDLSGDPASHAAPQLFTSGGEEAACATRALIAAVVARRVAGRLDDAIRLVDDGSPHVLAAAEQIGTPTETVAAAYCVQSANTRVLAGDPGGAREDLLLAWRWRHVDTLGFVAHETAGKLAALCASEGRLACAERWLGQAREWPARIAERFTVVPQFATVLAEFLVATEKLELDLAEQIEPQLALPTQGFEFFHWVLWARARRLLVGGHPRALLDLLDRMAEPRSHPDRGAFQDLRAAALLASGRIDDAAAVIDVRGDAPAARVLRARLLAMRLDFAAAIAELDNVPSTAAPRIGLEAQALRAASLVELGRRRDAASVFGALLDDLDGILSVLATIRPDVTTELFASAGQHPLAAPTEQAWQQRVRRSIYPFASDQVPSEPVRLTDRELVILRHLASGASRTAIARQEFVSVNTIKSQIAALYRKLGVSSAEDALAKTRGLTSSRASAAPADSRVSGADAEATADGAGTSSRS